MKYALALACLSAIALAAPLQAQTLQAQTVQAQQAGDRARTLDLGIGAQLGPTYPGAEEAEVSPWFLLGGGVPGTIDKQGFSIRPSIGTQGVRDRESAPELAALDGIDGAVELGARLAYGMGPVTVYGAARRGFGGHEGLTGEIGTRYRTNLTDRITLWSGIEAGYGDDEFNDTYFGVTPDQSLTSDFAAYDPQSGFNEAAITFEARYRLTPLTSILGEVRYGKLIGDAADSPVVQDEYQPSLRLGVTRRFSFGF